MKLIKTLLKAYIALSIISSLAAHMPQEMADAIEEKANEVIEFASEIAQKDSTEQEPASTDMSGEIELQFIDVGQGDSILVTCGEESMLVDAGDNNQGTKVQNYLQKQGIETLDYLVLTHPDADHIGGADVIITKFDIGTVLMPDYEKDTATYRDVIDALEYKSISPIDPDPGYEFTLGDAEITVLGPISEMEDANNNSIVLKIVYGDTSFLLMGDAEEEEEMAILSSGADVSCDVLKCGHHGSKTSSSEAFVEAASPTYAVISCAEGNDYGHPHAQTLNTLRMDGIQLFRTDEQGSITVTSDGETLTWNCSPSETWQSGDK